MASKRINIGKYLTCICCIMVSKPVNGMVFSGPITSSAVTLSGDVDVSSMTVSTMTISSLLNVTGAMLQIPGRIVQMKFSSSTVLDYSTVTSSTFTAVPSIVTSIALSNPKNFIRISLTGNLTTDDNGTPPAYITIYRDSTNLGDLILVLS